MLRGPLEEAFQGRRLAIIGGTTLFGFVGLILAVPVVGAAQAVYGYFIERRGWNAA
jgi:predicted PurR-regulated permease PerM